MDKLEKIKETVSHYVKKIIVVMKERKELALISGLGVMLVLLTLIVLIPNAQRGIRNQQTEALVMKPYEGIKKIAYIPYGKLDQTIASKDKIMVALVDPNDKYYPQLEQALCDQERLDKFAETVYLYPLIYDKKKISEFYQLESGLTLIYFEKNQGAQHEVDRLVLDSQKEIELYLIDHLSSLMRPTSSQMEAEAEKTARSKEQTTASTEEVIDELTEPTSSTESSTTPTN